MKEMRVRFYILRSFILFYNEKFYVLLLFTKWSLVFPPPSTSFVVGVFSVKATLQKISKRNKNKKIKALWFKTYLKCRKVVYTFQQLHVDYYTSPVRSSINNNTNHNKFQQPNCFELCKKNVIINKKGNFTAISMLSRELLLPSDRMRDKQTKKKQRYKKQTSIFYNRSSSIYSQQSICFKWIKNKRTTIARSLTLKMAKI